jgi:hypothetical protein
MGTGRKRESFEKGEGTERGEREEDGTVFTLEEEEEGDYGWEEKRVRSEFLERGG